MGYRYPFVIDKVCDDKLLQLQGPIDRILAARDQQKWGEVLAAMADAADIMTSYFQSCKTA